MKHHLFHWKPNPDRGMVMIPVGLYYNRKTQNAKKGDTIVFKDSNEEYKIEDLCYMDLNTSVARMLCRYIYKYELDAVMKRWQSNAVIEGNGRKAVSCNKCLIIRYGKKNTY